MVSRQRHRNKLENYIFAKSRN